MRTGSIEIPLSRRGGGSYGDDGEEEVIQETESLLIDGVDDDEKKTHPPAPRRLQDIIRPQKGTRRVGRVCIAGLKRQKVLSSITAVLVTFGVLYVVALRIAAGKKLGTVLTIFERAEYYPINNDVHSENRDMGDRYRRMLLSPKELSGGGVAIFPPAPYRGDSRCTPTYSMNLTDTEAQMMDLDDYDRELLGTIMVRLCACSCVGRGQAPMNQSLVLMEEILKGAHIVVHGDRGAFYSYFTQMQDSYRRTSSHHSIVPMYGIPEGQVLRTMLTGRNHEGDTWFQFEGANWAPFKRPAESWVHAVNYIQYTLTGRQVGPLGDSIHTDSRPIFVEFDGCTDSRRLLFRQFDKEDPTGRREVPASTTTSLPSSPLLRQPSPRDSRPSR